MFFDGIGVQHYFATASILFAVGIFGIISNVKNIISYIISLEVIFLSINIIFITVAKFLGNVNGQSMVIFILAITAAEVAMILGVVIMHYKTHGNIDTSSTKNLKEI